jgi:hypothetical protein
LAAALLLPFWPLRLHFSLLLTQQAPVLLPLQQLLTTGLRWASCRAAAAAAACCWLGLMTALMVWLLTVLLLHRAAPAAAP